MKRGYHRLLLDGSEVKGPLLVEFDETGKMKEWKYMEREEERVEWCGGTYKVRSENR